MVLHYGLVAQLGAHHIRIVGVEGSNPFKSTKKKRQFSTEDCRFFLFFSLFSFRSSLFSKIVVSREKRRDKREEKR